MTLSSLLAIDPGENGGIAWIDATGNVGAQKMPEGMCAQLDRLLELKAQLAGLCGQLPAWMEKVAVMPGDGRASAGVFMRHAGRLDAGLYLCGISSIEVLPSRWQRGIGVPQEPTLPKDMDPSTRKAELARRKAERKRWIRDTMQRRYPHLRVTLHTADALGILTWAIAQTTNAPAQTPFDA